MEEVVVDLKEVPNHQPPLLVAVVVLGRSIMMSKVERIIIMQRQV